MCLLLLTAKINGCFHKAKTKLSVFNIAIEEADDVLSHLDPTTLLTPAERALKPAIVMDIISLQVAHYALHVGQIAYATKLLNANAIDEVWRKTQP